MADVYRLTPPYHKERASRLVMLEPWLIEGAQGVPFLREKLSAIDISEPVTIDVKGAELAPESIAALFFFALEHQDRHGVLRVVNLGMEAFGLLRGMGADEMPMIYFTPAAAGEGFSLN